MSEFSSIWNLHKQISFDNVEITHMNPKMGSKCLASQFAYKYQHFKTRASKWIDKRNWNKMFPFLTIFLYTEHLFLHDPMMILPGTCTSMKFYLLCIYFSITWLHGEKGVLTNYRESWLWVWFFSTDNQIFRGSFNCK